MSFVVMATYYLGRIFAYLVLWDEPRAEFWPTALTGFYGRNIIDMAYYWAVIAVGYNTRHLSSLQERGAEVRVA